MKEQQSVSQGSGAAVVPVGIPEGPLDENLRAIEAQFDLATPVLQRVDELCTVLTEILLATGDGPRAALAHTRLLALLARGHGEAACRLFALLEAEAARATDAHAIVCGLLGAQSQELRERATLLAASLAKSGRLSISLPLISRLADALAGDGLSAMSSDARASIVEILDRVPATAVGALAGAPERAKQDPIEALFFHADEVSTRRLAAWILDEREGCPGSERCERLLGVEAHAFLRPLLDFTRATHADLVEFIPVAGRAPPALPSLRVAADVMGTLLLARVVGELGWSSVAWGIFVEPVVGLRVGGGHPFVVAPDEASLLEAAGGSRAWERFLVIGHGGSARAADTDASDEEAVQRFRRYNLVHAEILADIVEISPLDVARTRRIVECTDRIVADFLELFAEPEEEAPRLARHHRELRDRVLAALPSDASGDGLAVADEVVRLVQTFEDPSSLDEVRTLHGLKRFLHQEGLRRAFRRFRAARATNRRVDVALASPEKVLRVERRIRYLDFERGAGPATELPFVVSLAAQAVGRQLLQGLRAIPSMEILIYGNEIQVYVSFRNHPAFARIDLSPPLRGGMIDLEYFGVSQYEFDAHPDTTLQGIQRVFRRLGFDVHEESFRLHARYDKEHSFELGDLITKTRELFCLVPYLMDVDWLIGGLEIPVESRAVVADAWGAFLQSWGVLPVEEILTPDRRHIRSERRHGPVGEVEVRWDGYAPYRDCLSEVPGAGFWDRLRAVLERNGLWSVARWTETVGRVPAQLPLERAILEPLRAARVRGEVVASPAGLSLAPATIFRREHEAERLARLLSETGPRLAEAMRVAAVVAPLDRQLRFRASGSVQGLSVERALLALPGRDIGLFVLRDAGGMICLALAGPAPDLYCRRRDVRSPWQDAEVLFAAELTAELRRCNYGLAGVEPSIDVGDADRDERRARLRSGAAFAPAAFFPGEAVIVGISASPGWVAGPVCFGTAEPSAERLAGAVLVAPAIRPKDTPFIRRVAAVVSTGGGILSHAGLIALEQQKPALIVAGTWRREPDGAAVLACRRAQFSEESLCVGGLDVVRRTSFVEVEETLREGDLVVVDAEAGLLAVLGQDRDALALHDALKRIQSAAASLVRDEDDREILVLRGRFLRIVHELEKLLGRIERPTLARYAVRELLETRRAPPVIARRDARQLLLETLFGNPTCGQVAREAALQQRRDLVHRLEVLRAEAERAIPTSTSLYEILMLRLGVHRVRRVLEEIGHVMNVTQTDGVASSNVDGDIDDLARSRVAALRVDLDTTSVRASVAGASGDAAWRMRNAVRRLARLEHILGHERSTASLADDLDHRDADAMERLSPRRLLHSAETGLELAPLVGSKAARLGELVHAVGAERVPPWFVVTDRAFREAMETPPGPVARELGVERDRARTLGEAIEAILARGDTSPDQQSAAIRQLWLAHRFPPGFEEEIRRAVSSLGKDDGDHPTVAVRSSAFEEDTEGSSWAGQFDTFLFVRGEESLLEHLKLAMAGLWTARAIEYRRAFGGGNARIGGGVIVQRMVNSRTSGVLHTTCVAGGLLREMVINVGLGLGEGVVSGTADVDHVLVSKERQGAGGSLAIRYRVGEKRTRLVFDERAGFGTRREEALAHQRLRPALEYVELRELADLALALEDAYGEPLDVEFAYEAGALYVLQLRPVSVFQLALRETMERCPLRAESRSVEESKSHAT